MTVRQMARRMLNLFETAADEAIEDELRKARANGTPDECVDYAVEVLGRYKERLRRRATRWFKMNGG